MKIGITSKYPHTFVLSLATLFKQAGSVNIHTNGIYSKLLFDDTDNNQERNGIYFNSDEKEFDYEFYVNDDTLCDYRIIALRPYYRDIIELRELPLPTETDIVILTELVPTGLKYGHRLILSELNLPQATHYEIVSDERDYLIDCHFGMNTKFSIDQFSKPYRDCLLSLFNWCNGTSHTKLRHIKTKPVFTKKSVETEEPETTVEEE